MAKEFPLVSIEVKPVSTKFRKLSGSIPNDETIKQIKGLREAEPLSMRGQPPVIWDRAEGVNVLPATARNKSPMRLLIKLPNRCCTHIVLATRKGLS
jgi:hypothetical protein